VVHLIFSFLFHTRSFASNSERIDGKIKVVTKLEFRDCSFPGAYIHRLVANIFGFGEE
jgi:hypothetical protein